MDRSGGKWEIEGGRLEAGGNETYSSTTTSHSPTPPLGIPVEKVSGIGPTVTGRLKDMGIATVEELIMMGEGKLVEAGLNRTKAQQAFAHALTLLGTGVPEPA